MTTPWKYIGLLNECIKILITVALGFGLAHFRVFSSQDKARFIPAATKFVFYVALPCLVLKGLGISIDFYNEDVMSWEYIGSFLVLRAIALLLIVLWVTLKSACTSSVLKPSNINSDDNENSSESTTTSAGQVVVYWLASTWISTVILGVPIASAVFGNPNLGLQYGVLAAVSSFIFQLPLQLFLLESHTVILEEQLSANSEPIITTQNGGQVQDRDEETGPATQPPKPQEEAPLPMTTIPSSKSTQSNAVPQSTVFGMFFRRCDIWKKIACQLAVNPVLWAVVLGFILTLSTVGPRYLKPSSEDYVAGLGWIWLTVSWFGACVSPVALFSMGVWMQCHFESRRAQRQQGQQQQQQEGEEPFDHPKAHVTVTMSIVRALSFMIIKLILVPLLMVGLALAIKLDDQSGRAAVLIAALPISLASFTLASRYNVGEDVLSQNVVLGTLLILPTVLGWNAVLDAVGLFPIEGQ